MAIMTQFQEFILSLLEPIPNSFLRIVWEARIPNNKLMKIVPEELSTFRSAMAIINAEE